jgi:putative FmdB family regulatory protein
VPTYDYKCTSCENQYEKREGFDAPPRQACPRCGAVAKRVLHPPPIVFKGSGFYITDSRKGSSATVGDMPSSSPNSSDGKSDSSSNGASADNKPASAATSSASSDKSD